MRLIRDMPSHEVRLNKSLDLFIGVFTYLAESSLEQQIRFHHIIE